MRIILSAALLLVAISARGATIAITSDQPTYEIGDTITLSILGDPEDGTDWGVFGTLRWDPARADTLAVIQEPLGPDWVVAGMGLGDGVATVFNQIHESAFASTDEVAGVPGVPITSTILLQATAPGTLTFNWDTELVFFGATAESFSIQIAGEIPAPVEPPVVEPEPTPEPVTPVVEPPAPDPVVVEPTPEPIVEPYAPPASYEPVGGVAVPEPSAALVFATSLIVCVVATRKRAR